MRLLRADKTPIEGHRPTPEFRLKVHSFSMKEKRNLDKHFPKIENQQSADGKLNLTSTANPANKTTSSSPQKNTTNIACN
jgi:hypothetical protein